MNNSWLIRDNSCQKKKHECPWIAHELFMNWKKEKIVKQKEKEKMKKIYVAPLMTVEKLLIGDILQGGFIEGSTIGGTDTPADPDDPELGNRRNSIWGDNDASSKSLW